MAITNLQAGEPQLVGGQLRVTLTWQMPNGTSVKVKYRDKDGSQQDVQFPDNNTTHTVSTLQVPYVYGHHFVYVVQNAASGQEADYAMIGNGSTNAIHPTDYYRAGSGGSGSSGSGSASGSGSGVSGSGNTGGTATISNFVAGEPTLIGGELKVPLSWSVSPSNAPLKIKYRDKNGSQQDIDVATNFTGTTFNAPYIAGHYFVYVVVTMDGTAFSIIGNGSSNTPHSSDYYRAASGSGSGSGVGSGSGSGSGSSTGGGGSTPTGGGGYVPPATTPTQEVTASSRKWTWHYYVLLAALLGGVGYLAYRFIVGGKN